MSKNQSEVLLLNVKKSGKGPKNLLLFHGFGQNHSAFESYFEELKPHYTLYAFDLPFHGESEWPTQKVDGDLWKASLEKFIFSENIERFSVLAFSLGGRFAIQTLLHFHQKMDRITLIAPDGIYKSVWYRLANSLLLKPVFYYLMSNEGKFERFLSIIEKTYLVPNTLIKFSRKELDSPENKLRVFHSWTSLRPLQVPTRQLLSTVHSSESIITVVLGSKDTIIPTSEILKKIGHATRIEIHHLPSRHHHLVAEAKPLIISIFQEEEK